MMRIPGSTRPALMYGVYSLTGMYGEVPVAEAQRLLAAVIDTGIEAVDTADIYGRGLGEELVSEVAGRVFIATKIGYDPSSQKPVVRWDIDYLLKAAEASRRRLRVDAIDLLQIHNPPLEALKGEEVYRALRIIKEKGIAIHTGVALGPEVDVLEHALEALEHEEVESLQFVYNMLEQEPGYTISREARKHGVAVIARVPHAGGILDETLTPSQVEDLRDHRRLRKKGWYQWAFRVYKTRIKPLLDKHPGTPGQKALKFIQQSINPDAIVIIAKDVARVKEYLDFHNIPEIPEGVIKELRRIYLEEASLSPEAPTTLIKHKET